MEADLPGEASFEGRNGRHAQCLLIKPSPQTRHILSSLPVCLSVCTAAAAATQGIQTPGHFGGFSSDGSVFTVADDFRLEQTTQIVGLTWWGGYFNQPTSPDAFTVRIFSDDGGSPGVQRSFEGEPWQPYFDNTAFALTVIPEPGSTLAVALGLGVLGLWRHRR